MSKKLSRAELFETVVMNFEYEDDETLKEMIREVYREAHAAGRGLLTDSEMVWCAALRHCRTAALWRQTEYEEEE